MQTCFSITRKNRVWKAAPLKKIGIVYKISGKNFVNISNNSNFSLYLEINVSSIFYFCLEIIFLTKNRITFWFIKLEFGVNAGLGLYEASPRETQNKTQQSWLYFKDVVACSRSFSLFPIKIPIPALYPSVFALKITLRFTTRWSKWWWRCKSLWRPSRTLKRRSPRP